MVLAAFLEWDTGCFARLRGMFAVALWTRIARAPGAGARPHGHQAALHGAARRDLYFGSELKTIFVHPEIERSLNPAALDCYLSLNYVPAPCTLVEGIEKLRPGHWLEWQRRPDAVGAVLAALPREADRALESSTRPRRSWIRCSSSPSASTCCRDVPLGMWLSGGIDSSTLLHYAAAASSIAPEDVFDFLSRPELRRNGVHPAHGGRSTAPITRSST